MTTKEKYFDELKQQIRQDSSINLTAEDVSVHPTSTTIKINGNIIEDTTGKFLKSLRKKGYVVEEVHESHFYMGKVEAREEEVCETVTRLKRSHLP